MEYEKMTLVQLREEAKKLGLESITGLKKAELIEKLNKKQDNSQ